MDIKTLEQYIDKYSQISQSMMNSMYVIQKMPLPIVLLHQINSI